MGSRPGLSPRITTAVALYGALGELSAGSNAVVLYG
jgi:hypothetical protein